MMHLFRPSNSNHLFFGRNHFLCLMVFILLVSFGCRNATQKKRGDIDSSNALNSANPTKFGPGPQTNQLYDLYLSKIELAAIFRRFGDSNNVKFIMFEPTYTLNDTITLAAFAGYKSGPKSSYEEKDKKDTTPVILHIDSSVSQYTMKGANFLLAGQEVSSINEANNGLNDLKTLRQMKNNDSFNYIIFVPHVNLYPGSNSLYEITYGIAPSSVIPTITIENIVVPVISTNPTPPRNSY